MSILIRFSIIRLEESASRGKSFNKNIANDAFQKLIHVQIRNKIFSKTNRFFLFSPPKFGALDMQQC